MAWQHRPALDGLRTVAVYLVLCFHAKLAWADGGFIGVDLFFVLSGFLVASILLEERYTTGTIKLASFFGRRIRRLLPAALVVVVATAAVFLLVAPVVRRLPWVGDAQASLLYVANWRFLHNAGDYFGADVNTSPYLHFWSLSVEEQFYVAFPFVLLGLVALKKWWRPALVTGIGVLFLASVGAQLWWMHADANHAYYGTDARIYQPLAGVLAAIAWRHLASRRRALRHAGWPMLVGLLLVSTSLIDVPVSVRGLLATAFGVGLVLAVMTRTSPSLDRFLSLAPISYLGRISYGTYLWHWPVLLLVLAGIHADPWVVALLTAAIATGLAALSYELLEHPVRRSAFLSKFSGQTVLIGLTCSVLAAYAVLPGVLKSDTRPALASSAASAPTLTGTAVGTTTNARAGEIAKPSDPVPHIDWEAISRSRGFDTSYCTLTDTTSCVAHTGTSGLKVMLVGDSHARVMAPLMLKLAQQKNFTLAYSMVAACPWQNGVISKFAAPDEQSGCSAARSALYGGLLQKMDIDLVVLTEMPRSADSWEHGLISTTGSTASVDQLNLDTITSSLQTIKRDGAKALAIDSWIVRYDGVNPLECLSGAKTVGDCAVTAPPPPLTDDFVHTLDVRSSAVSTTNFNDIVCPTYPVCQAVLNGIPVWRDDKHYSTEVLLDHYDEIRDRLVATGLFG